MAEVTGFKIGDLARSAGLSVRAVRYYDQIGLLVPSGRSPAGQRLYSDADIRRLYRICLLRQAGFALAEIGQALDEPKWDLRHAVLAHLDLLDQRIAVGQALRRRLARMAEALAADDSPSTAEVLETLEEMTMLNDAVHQRISILVYDDIPAIHAYLVRVFGLGEGRLVYADDSTCVHGEVQAGDGAIWLHQVSSRFGLASPKSLGGANGITAVMVDDVDAHFAYAVEQGAEIVHEPVDEPYGYREYSARDPEGGLWSFMKPLGD
jgi:MerR family transcriptional regulator, thiopeptide resistance regulator